MLRYPYRIKFLACECDSSELPKRLIDSSVYRDARAPRQREIDPTDISPPEVDVESR